jgi:hypothetical protein
MAVLGGGSAAEHFQGGSEEVPDSRARHLIPERPLERAAGQEHRLARLARTMDPDRILASGRKQGALEDVDRGPELPEERHHQKQQ